MVPPAPTSTLFPYTTLFRSLKLYTFDSTPKRGWWFDDQKLAYPIWEKARKLGLKNIGCHKGIPFGYASRSEEHTSELQSLTNLVCRLLLEKKNNTYVQHRSG